MGSISPPQIPHFVHNDKRRELDESASSSDHYTRQAHLHAAETEGYRTTYKTVESAVRSSGLTVDDIVNMTNKFWDWYFTAAGIVDSSAGATFSIHTNLVIGTIGPHAKEQPHLSLLLERLLNFEICGKYLLTEVGRGLDARNIETTATLSRDGTTFDFHTPHPAAAKSMPPTTPLGGVPKMAVVFAQLVIEGQKQGVRAFVVHLTDGSRMCRGVSSKLLPQRPGIGPLDYAVTSFNHVTLDRGCLLGDLNKGGDQRASFFEEVHRISVGSLALSLVNVPALKAASYLVYSFSHRRLVTHPTTKLPISILSFPTQYGPVISAAAHAAVMEGAGRVTIGVFQTEGVPDILRAALTCIFKATITYSTQRYLSELTDRCGWRGLYAHNRISGIQLSMKGNSIAEGDVLVLCIRLASELVQGKYPLPPSDNPNSLLARREQGLFDELRTFATRDDLGNSNHRSDSFAQNVTPRSRDLIEAIGHRLAYDSVIDSGTVRQELIDVWEANCILEYPAWYVEHAGMTSREIHKRQVSAIEKLRPHLGAIIEEFEMDKDFDNTPLVTHEAEDEFMQGLPSFGDVGDVTQGIAKSLRNPFDEEKTPRHSSEFEAAHDASERTTAQRWSLTKRCFVVGVISLYTFVVYAASAIYVIGLPQIIAEFRISEQEALLGLSLYVFAYGLGPMVWAPISELPWIGRRPVYSLTFVAFLCFSVLASTAQNWRGYLAIRFFQAFFGSPCLATGGATMHDMFPHSTVPFSLTIWIAAAFCGPALGPVLAGYVVPEQGWRLGMWEIAYMAGPTALLLLLVPETYEPAIQARRTRALDEVRCSQKHQAGAQERLQVLLSSLLDAVIVPVQIVMLDPAVAVANLYTSFIYGTYYTLFDAIPRVYPVRYGFTAGTLGLSFLHVFVACILAGLLYSAYVYRILNPANLRGRLTTHEDRLRPALIACCLPPIGLFLFAWTSDGSIHWIVGIIGLTLYAIGTFTILQCLSVYLPRIYPLYSASLFASNDFCRSSLATGAVHFGVPLYENLGVAHGVSILAGLSVLGIPGMWFIFWKGASLRAKSRFVEYKPAHDARREI